MDILWDFLQGTGLSFLAIAIPNFIYIGLRAFQTQNIIGSNYAALWIAGLFLATAEAYIIQYVAERGPTFTVILGLWVGGTSGAHISILAHHYLHPNKLNN